MAKPAGTSTRTLIRRFRDQTGTTPLQWLQRVRIRHAQHLLETPVTFFVGPEPGPRSPGPV
ncbi:helix-turn-helix domain-containing protein [Nocardia cyriacigeorgica]|uniref:helix-turn-helix domain-containing protein n=1 Tax=Nocardia cyriacigeorgica TaxID=135487 RepID=UPI003A5CD8E3